jgi:DNA-3-methyladenine glycosylase
MQNISARLQQEFFLRDVLEVAPDLLGKYFIRKNKSVITCYRITEVEAYRGEEDMACHASKGRTPRTEIMYHKGGHLYVYLIYGMYWMLNVVTGNENHPQAILIRGIEGFMGPGRLTRQLGIDKSFYGEDLVSSGRIWIENGPVIKNFRSSPRIGIDYAGEPWKSKKWRYFLTD